MASRELLTIEEIQARIQAKIKDRISEYGNNGIKRHDVEWVFELNMFEGRLGELVGKRLEITHFKGDMSKYQNDIINEVIEILASCYSMLMNPI